MGLLNGLLTTEVGLRIDYIRSAISLKYGGLDCRRMGSLGEVVYGDVHFHTLMNDSDISYNFKNVKEGACEQLPISYKTM